MRPTFVHVLTGLLLGTALAGLLNVPGRVVAHQESIPPVRSPHAAKPTKDIVVRVSPSVERALEAERARRAKPRPKPRFSPRVDYRRVVVRVPQPPAVASPSPPPKGAQASRGKRMARPRRWSRTRPGGVRAGLPGGAGSRLAVMVSRGSPCLGGGRGDGQCFILTPSRTTRLIQPGADADRPVPGSLDKIAVLPADQEGAGLK